MNVEIGAEAALFPENEYIKGIFVAVHVERKGKMQGQAGSVLPGFASR
jgi:hypothetical protein